MLKLPLLSSKYIYFWKNIHSNDLTNDMSKIDLKSLSIELTSIFIQSIDSLLKKEVHLERIDLN